MVLVSARATGEAGARRGAGRQAAGRLRAHRRRRIRRPRRSAPMFGAVTLEKITARAGGLRCSNRCSPTPNSSSARPGGRRCTSWSTSLVFIVAIVVPLMLSVAYLTLWERKLIGWMQIRIGPNRVGPLGPAAADRRRRQAAVQGSDHPGQRQQDPVRAGADGDDRPGDRGLGGDPVRARTWCWPTSTRACST